MERIAIPSLGIGMDANVARHFGKASRIVFVDVEEGREESVFHVDLPEEHNPGDLPSIIKEQNAQTILAYGMGQRAREFFEMYGIRVITGVVGDTVKDVVEDYLRNKLVLESDWEQKPEFEHHDH